MQATHGSSRTLELLWKYDLPLFSSRTCGFSLKGQGIPRTLNSVYLLGFEPQGLTMGGRQSSTSNPSGTIDCGPFWSRCSALCPCPVIWWFFRLDEIERCRLAGLILSCVATVLATITISTEFWVKRFVRGIFVFCGLWTECQLGSCARPEKVHLYVVGSIMLMLISLVASYGTVISGTLSFTPLPRPQTLSWPWLATALSFISGITGGMGLFNYMRLATAEPGSYLSWSLAAGWLAVIAIFVSGICYFWASRWEQELLCEQPGTSRTLLTLAEECRFMEADDLLRKRSQPSDTSL